jgi:uncharacterized protein YbaR (Trm112 family)
MEEGDLTGMLACPATMKTLRLASETELAVIRNISRNAALEAALVREDRLVAYPVSGGIPVVMQEAAIDLRKPNNQP